MVKKSSVKGSSSPRADDVRIPLAARIRIEAGSISASFDYGTVGARQFAEFLLHSFGVDADDFAA